MSGFESFHVEMPMGQLTIMPQGMLTVHIKTEQFKVNGIDVQGNLWLVDDGEGFKVESYYFSRCAGGLNNLPSKTRDRVIKILAHEGKKLAEAHPERLHAAEMIGLQYKLECAEGDVKKQRTRLESLEARRDNFGKLERQMAQLDYPKARAAALVQAKQEKEEEEREKAQKRSWRG